ncbi:hypothetical protein D3C71_1945720 [compost metagenome]
MPTRLAIASHQMCQIIAKPNTVSRAPMTTPVAVLFGMWIGSYLAGALYAVPFSLASVNGSTQSAFGSTAKL